MNNPPSLTPRQLEAFKVIQRIYMAWVTLIVVLVLFTVCLGFFLYAVFWGDAHVTPTSILGVIDGILGWCLKAIINYLFPSPTANQHDS